MSSDIDPAGYWAIVDGHRATGRLSPDDPRRVINPRVRGELLVHDADPVLFSTGQRVAVTGTLAGHTGEWQLDAEVVTAEPDGGGCRLRLEASLPGSLLGRAPESREIRNDRQR